MFRLLALSTIGVVSAAPGNVTALCELLTTAPCNTFQFMGLGYTVADCEALFGVLGTDLGMDTDMGVDTIGCRQRNAMASNSSCRYAGVTGGGQCGSVLGAACNAVTKVCMGATPPPYDGNATACMQAAGGLGAIGAQWGSKQGADASNEDSLECRVYHALAGYNKGGAIADPHCNHTFSPSGYAGVCSGAIAVNNRHYCDTTLTFCSSTATALPQYNSVSDCLASIANFPVGTNDARATNAANDQGCRQYHTQAAASGAGVVHCTHGGPSGANVCGGPNSTRDSWKIIAGNAACTNANMTLWSTAINLAFSGWNRADLDAVIPTSTSSYKTDFMGDNDYCRIYHSTVAAGGALSHCEHGAIQSSTCFDTGMPPAVPAVCRMIQAGCGNSSGFADVPACLAALGPVAASKPGDNMTLTPAATDTFACRAYQAAIALSAKKLGQSVATACENVKAAAGPLCGGSVAPPAKSAASTLFVSAAIALPFLM